jgi:superfamily II DNA or RNA helicase
MKLISENLKLPKDTRVQPLNYILPNRKGFINWFDSTYGTYRVKKGTKFVKGAKFSFFNHQKIIRDYISKESPFRGLLLYHGLGVGKTCGSIAIAEGFRSDRKVIVMLNKSLRQNFRDNLKFCGYDYFRINQHWHFHKFTENDPMKLYARKLGITLKRDLKGAWFIDFKKTPNYEELSNTEQKQVDDQINTMIDSKYTFINLDGLNEKKLIRMNEDRVFDDSILIIDEVHNLTNAMSKGTPGVRAKYLEELIMNAINLKLVFLSGTPMINNLYETAKLFNLLRGYIKTFEITISKKRDEAFFKSLEQVLKKNKLIDQFFIDSRNRFISLTRTPLGFIKTNVGFESNLEQNNYSEPEFLDYLRSILPSDIQINIKNYTAFPNTEDEFMKLFYDTAKNQIKNKELFKSRIMGMISFYRTQDKSLIPSVNRNELVEVPMSDYQFVNYASVRKVEIEQDKNKNKSKGKKKPKKKSDDEYKEDIFDIKSSYRAYSRMHCSFVFPETIPRPYPQDSKGMPLEDLVEDMDLDADFTDVPDEKQETKARLHRYELEKAKALRELEKHKEEYLLEGVEEQLPKYSPKYNIIVNSIKDTKGLSFVYTEYKTLEGIAVLSIVLKANGYAPFIIKQNDRGEWLQEYESPEDKDKPKYAFWGGNAEESDIIRKVYNNEYDELPKSLRDQLTKTSKTNLRGETVKVLLTTKTGAEGIDLHNVRQVHIVEPYWNPVRMKQVKGRAIRVGSHLQLPEDERNVDLFLYLAVIPPTLMKSDKIIENDNNGKTSDQVLYELSQKKLEVMESLLRIIKEASIDCSINFNDTYDAEEPFKCLNYGTTISRDNYSFVPNVTKQLEDKDQSRKVIKSSWKPTIIKLKIKGEIKAFALKPAPADQKQLLFDLDLIRDSGRPGNPIGEIKINADGKKSVVFYPKAQLKTSGINPKKSKKKTKKIRKSTKSTKSKRRTKKKSKTK